MPKKKRHKRSKYTVLREKAETIFHSWIRERDKNKRCCTCLEGDPEQAGHWEHNTCDFEEWNLHGQCVRCNYFRSGAGNDYTLFMIRKYGLKKTEEYKKLAVQGRGRKYLLGELREIIKKYDL